jgi:Type I restriction-modification system methyltransferase subunit
MKDITFEDKLWKAADKLRKKVEVHEYKYIVLGLLFLRADDTGFGFGNKSLTPATPKLNWKRGTRC